MGGKYNPYIISVENTAISTGISKSVRDFAGVVERKQPVLDYGSGRLRNSRYLLESGFRNLSVLDTKLQMSRLSNAEKAGYEVYEADGNMPTKQFDYILCNYVLNVIPHIETRNEVISNIYQLLSNTGVALFEVRRERSISKCKHMIGYQDGFVVGNATIKTFQKPYSLEELTFALESFGFYIVSSRKNSESVAALVCKSAVKGYEQVSLLSNERLVS